MFTRSRGVRLLLASASAWLFCIHGGTICLLNQNRSMRISRSKNLWWRWWERNPPARHRGRVQSVNKLSNWPNPQHQKVDTAISANLIKTAITYKDLQQTLPKWVKNSSRLSVVARRCNKRFDNHMWTCSYAVVIAAKTVPSIPDWMAAGKIAEMLYRQEGTAKSHITTFTALQNWHIKPRPKEFAILCKHWNRLDKVPEGKK